MPPADFEIELRPIEPGDTLTGLSLGDPKFTPLKTFLQKRAKTYEEENLARTYAFFRLPEHKVIAYITLVCGEVVIEDNDDPLLPGEVDYHYRSYPAVKIARLAVDQRYRKADLGRRLVAFGLGVVKTSVCPSVGCRFVMVDSKEDSIGFYERCGFTMLDTPANRARSEPVMFIDLKKVSQISS